MSDVRLHINIDHVATLRNARDTAYPDPVEAATRCLAAGADGITAHLREDRRHIRDADVARLRAAVPSGRIFNLEMAATDEMVAIAIKTKPDVVTLVPERREERTTEGGLDVVAGGTLLRSYVGKLVAAGIKVSLFIAGDEAQILASKAMGATQIEIHTGDYAHGESGLHDLAAAARYAHGNGLEVAAGHGLTRGNVGGLMLIREIVELNIGHAVVSDAVFLGIEGAVKAMRAAMNER